MENVFKKLSEINVSDKVEKKGNQDYLSWSHAWGLAKQLYPSMQRVVYEDSMTGLNYFNDGKTAYVKVGIVIDGLEHIDYLPIMDFRNQSILIEKVTSMDVNKTIQRSTVKALALHGLGLKLWSGEDLVDSTKTAKVMTSTKIDLAVNDTNWAGVVKYVEANKTKLDLATIVKNLSVKYNLSTSVKKTLGDLLK
jgi:hypothetical protein